MTILLAILLVIVITVIALFYRSKAKEFESLFELSKGYEEKEGLDASYAHIVAKEKTSPKYTATSYTNSPNMITVKLNKEGSIAKKRGPKAKKK